MTSLFSRSNQNGAPIETAMIEIASPVNFKRIKVRFGEKTYVRGESLLLEYQRLYHSSRVHQSGSLVASPADAD